MSKAVAHALAQLEENGWTLTAIAEEIGEKLLAVYRWRDGTRSPIEPEVVLGKINSLPQPRPRRTLKRKDGLPPER